MSRVGIKRRFPNHAIPESGFVECKRCGLPFFWSEVMNVGTHQDPVPLCRGCYRFFIWDGKTEEVTKP